MEQENDRGVYDEFMKKVTMHVDKQWRKKMVKDYLVKAAIIIFAISGFVVVCAIANKAEKDANNGHYAFDTNGNVIQDEIDPA